MRSILAIPAWAMVALLPLVAGCGGSSSSSTGPSNFRASGSAGSSGATVQGQLLQGSGSAQSESVLVVVFDVPKNAVHGGKLQINDTWSGDKAYIGLGV